MVVRRITNLPNRGPFGEPIRFYIEVSEFSYDKLATALKLDDYDAERARGGEPEEVLRRQLAFVLRDRMLAVIKKLGEYTVKGI